MVRAGSALLSRLDVRLSESHNAPVVLVLFAPFSSLCREVMPTLQHVAESAALLMCLMDGSVDEAVAREVSANYRVLPMRSWLLT